MQAFPTRFRFTLGWTVIFLGAIGLWTTSNLNAQVSSIAADRPSSVDAAAADLSVDWPNWMGPEGRGISTESGWASSWPDEGLKEIWSKEIGIGFSSISISHGRLYTAGHRAGTETIYCLNADDGRLLWKHEYPCRLIDNLYEGGPGATPSIGDGLVYMVGKEGQFLCLEADTGDVVWEKALPDDLGVPVPEWGFNCSPLILGDEVIIQGGRVASYDQRTGDKNWQSDRHLAGYGCVRPLRSGHQDYLTVLDCEAIRVLNASDGSEVDAFPWESPFGTNSTTPIVEDDTVFVSTGYQVGCGLFRFTHGRLELVYENREMRNHFNNSILWNGFLYGFDGNSNLGRVVQLKCMNQMTGEVAWAHSGLGCGSLMVANGKLLLLSDDGQLVLAKASPESFEKLSESKILDGRCWTVPVLHRQHVFARNAEGRLVCVRLPTSPVP